MKLEVDTSRASPRDENGHSRVRKVLHVIPSIGPLRGGPSVMVRNLARNLAARGIETHIAATDDNGPGRLNVPLNAPTIDDGVTYWYFPRQTRFYTFSWPLMQWLRRNVARFDVIHIHALFSFATLPAAYWARRRGVPYIVRPLGTLNEWGMKNRRPWLKNLSFRWIESRILDHASAVHYTSEQERDEAGRLGVNAPARVIANALPDDSAGVDRNLFFDRIPHLRGRRVILFLSRLDAKKGLDLLLPAMVYVRREAPDAVLVIAGQGTPEFTEHLKTEAARLGIEDVITWAGFLAGDLKQSAFAAAQFYVLPSYSENFGIAVVEAMAAGLAVIVSDQVAIHDEIARSQAGLVVPCDVPALATAVLRLLANADLCSAMGLRARDLVRREYSPEAVTEKLIDVYSEFVR